MDKATAAQRLKADVVPGTKPKVVKYRRMDSGRWYFGVFACVVFRGETMVEDVTNLFGPCVGREVKCNNRTNNWEINANIGYDIQTWVEDNWSDIMDD